MGLTFAAQPILNSPYAYPCRHWRLVDGAPSDDIVEMRRQSEYVTPVPPARRQAGQGALTLGVAGLSSEEQQFDPAPIINEIRRRVDAWRQLPNPADWGVTAETARLLQHWRHYDFPGPRPFFCQVEAAETVIWLTEVAGILPEGGGGGGGRRGYGGILPDGGVGGGRRGYDDILPAGGGGRRRGYDGILPESNGRGRRREYDGMLPEGGTGGSRRRGEYDGMLPGGGGGSRRGRGYDAIAPAGGVGGRRGQGGRGRRRGYEGIRSHLVRCNGDANPDLFRIALKLATGAGKTTVMAMLIAWQTVNAVRYPNRRAFTKGFLVVTPGITIRDRLRVLLPNDPENYYAHRDLAPKDMLGDVRKARVVITNYHAFRRREQEALTAGTRRLVQGRTGAAPDTLESEGQMLRRVMPELLRLPRTLIINDEGHHCYRERAAEAAAERALAAEERPEAEQNNAAARLWIGGLEAVRRTTGVIGTIDLSATPFFLRGSGYPEGTLFPWTVCDFSLMDAIESGIVKIPRVPVADNAPGGGGDAGAASFYNPTFRNLWGNIRDELPRAGRRVGRDLDPRNLPSELLSALDALYGHYEKTFELWDDARLDTPPVFIVVCSNTAVSKLIYDYIAGFETDGEAGGGGGDTFLGHFPLFRNYDGNGRRLALPRTLLIDSAQLESGDALAADFRAAAADALGRFRRERAQRGGERPASGDANGAGAAGISDAELLREVMNTVGKPGRLGAGIRCVVSVSMLTEGWDANTVTHILGVRAFGTQLLCEQVVGRALRRQSYDLNEDGLLAAEYADVLGVPFDFTAAPVVAPPKPPAPTVRVYAVRPERDRLEIVFPRVTGYRVELPDERIGARFSPDSALELTPELVGPSVTSNQGIIGQGVDLTLAHLAAVRRQTIIYELARHLLERGFREPGATPPLHLFPQARRIVARWLDEGYLRCIGGTEPAQALYLPIADLVAERIRAAIVDEMGDGGGGARRIKAVIDPYTPTGSTRYVNFVTASRNRWQTDAGKCHINWAVCDQGWETEFCRVVEQHPRVVAYAKNRGLGLEVPYRMQSSSRVYLPDFIVRIDDGRGPDDLLNLVAEVKGYRGEDATAKALTMRSYWAPGVNNLGDYGRWAFHEFASVYEMAAEFEGVAAGV